MESAKEINAKLDLECRTCFPGNMQMNLFSDGDFRRHLQSEHGLTLKQFNELKNGPDPWRHFANQMVRIALKTGESVTGRCSEIDEYQLILQDSKGNPRLLSKRWIADVQLAR